MTVALHVRAVSARQLAQGASKLSNPTTSPSFKHGRQKWSQKAANTGVSTAPSMTLVVSTPPTPIKLTTDVDCR
jgi:hypothetical protein